MGSRVTRLDINFSAMYEIRRGAGVVAEVEKRADQVLAAAGGEDAGYKRGTTQGAKRPQGRWRATVYTYNGKGIRDNAANHTLQRSIDSAR
ncbi:hypothetical protein ACFWPK_04320 [Nocardia sp. NPDC058519]|uniref:hypothetical protein n=1 Tax=Nocardia sp. NPDC058519 TaxID=3346535 RepID=UPI00365F8FC9